MNPALRLHREAMVAALPLMRRLAVAGALALALLSCSPDNGGATRVIVIGEQPASLGTPGEEPPNEASAVLRGAIAQGLVRFDEAGQIEPGLAERWNVSDDGLSYIFRLATGEWPDGRPIVARDVARILNRQLKASSRNPLKDALGAVDEIVAMTDRVIEVRLKAPRPYLLQLLAQPQFAIVREGHGTGPFLIEPGQQDPGVVAMARKFRAVDD